MAENKIRKSINSVVLSGTLVKDPEFKQLESGFNILGFSIANNYFQKKGDSYSSAVNYFDIKVLGKRSESLSKVLKKGFGVNVVAEARQERWTNGEGKVCSKVVFNANEVEIIHWPKNSAQDSGGTGQESFSDSSEPVDNGGFSEDCPF